jgi:putative membrane protein
MHRRNLLAGIAFAGVLPVVGSAMAQSSRTMERGKMQALMGGDFATMSSELALKRGSSAAVRTFARLEISEQAAVAEAFGARPGSAGVSARHQAMLERLQAARGRDFDRMYIDGQIAGHKELLTIHRRYARSGSDPMARGASTVAVPAIETHLAMLMTMQKSLS